MVNIFFTSDLCRLLESWQGYYICLIKLCKVSTMYVLVSTGFRGREPPFKSWICWLYPWKFLKTTYLLCTFLHSSIKWGSYYGIHFIKLLCVLTELIYVRCLAIPWCIEALSWMFAAVIYHFPPSAGRDLCRACYPISVGEPLGN